MCLSDTFNTSSFCSFGSLICCICLCALVSLCEEQTEDSRGEEDEEEEALAPDARSPQEQPANTDVSASLLHHLDEVNHRYWRKVTKYLPTIIFCKNKCFFEFSYLF